MVGSRVTFFAPDENAIVPVMNHAFSENVEG